MTKFSDAKTGLESTPQAGEDAPPSTMPDVENQNHQPPPPPQSAGGGNGGVLRRWKREDLLKRGLLGLRSIALICSIISFLVMATNNHGDWGEFDQYEEYSYVLAISILSMLYTGGQVLRQYLEMYKAKNCLQPKTGLLVDFVGDQVMAYLTISAASSAVPLTNSMREDSDNMFTDASAASISFLFFTFFAAAASSLFSGYKLSIQSYI